MTLPIFVKVCGVTRAGDARRASALGARAIGLVFHPESPRRVGPRAAARVRDALPAGVLAVGVFAADPRREREIIEAAVRLSLDLIQLHGPSAAAMVPRLGAGRCVAAVTAPEEIDRAVACGAAYLLADRPRVAGVPQGASADRAIVRRLVRSHPWTILAGGLSPGNVVETARAVHPFGVDVSAGVEAEGTPGIKDPRMLEAFFEALSERGDTCVRERA